MTTIAILPEAGEGDAPTFSAIAAGQQATGRTAGEALDTLTAQLGAAAFGATVILQQFHPDRHFTADQRARLSDLMARWRAARETGGALPPTEQADLERLVDEELQGATDRTAQILSDLETSRSLRPRPEKPVAELKATLEREQQRTANLCRAATVERVLNTFLIFLTRLSLHVLIILIRLRGSSADSNKHIDQTEGR
jgi:hypothetical protein